MNARLILDGKRSATMNMAVDEALMLAQRAADAVPTLRFYGWTEPAWTVGYFQDAAAIGRQRRAHVVRRLTGGGAVRHGKDLTFSLCLRRPSVFFTGNVKDSYLKINGALIAGLRASYPSIDYADCKKIPSGRGGERVCFESPSCYDLMLNGKKVVGASQRRSGSALLHQSTVFLGDAADALARLIVDGFEKKWGLKFERSDLTAAEEAAAEKLERERYSSEAWAYPTALCAVV